MTTMVTVQETHNFWDDVQIDSFFYLQNKSDVFEGIRFFGFTVWTYMNYE